MIIGNVCNKWFEDHREFLGKGWNWHFVGHVDWHWRDHRGITKANEHGCSTRVQREDKSYNTHGNGYIEKWGGGVSDKLKEDGSTSDFH